jgi:ribosome maturation factor RimP
MISLTENITEIVESVLRDHDVFLVDLEVKGSGKQTLISVFLDNELTGLNIDICAKISREVSFLIESRSLIEDKYTLNVSSPGLDRPLKDHRQFTKNIGRNASVKYTTEQGNKTIKGVFTGFNETQLILDLGKEGESTVERSAILEFKILPAF